MEPAMRAFFLFAGLVLWAGLWLSGFENIHWLLYLPATFFLFSSLTGICPGMILFQELFKDKQTRSID